MKGAADLPQLGIFHELKGILHHRGIAVQGFWWRFVDRFAVQGRSIAVLRCDTVEGLVQGRLAVTTLPEINSPGACSRTGPTRASSGRRFGIDKNASERALRDAALGRKNYFFAGSDAGER